MQIIIQGHGMELTPALKTYAQKKFTKLTQYFENIPKVEILLDARNSEDLNRSQVAEATVWLAGKKVVRASEAGQDMYAAIDLVFDEISRQVKKHKEKHRQARRREGSKIKEATHATQLSSAPAAASEPVIVNVKSFADKIMRDNEAVEEFKIAHQDFLMYRSADSKAVSIVCLKNKKPEVLAPKRLKSLSPEQAQAELEKGKSHFYTFKNSSTNETNLIYKRNSGNYGLIEPSL
ncbi:MAG: ribosome-associated translation inhibitor RaiA [Candidatus Margulisbacteria bacterium]|nr:ribosome-associated translation inhibitor RaiA [Candidatus Margulisiibacteriota bacterium]MBU1022537.1 ribosome-associated translation inhibitor RaiA [Candidatus Margulisiibacteriota bacterium]MBU1728823.1 ribosome-associated translation inhibitor RaiA [Candidatus Margulisiibacteriota bacterium]MBU1955789.1 ribosome-associated translation inhibitor RaiA [Candidatus Margulisiibacteriota bacterium]